MYKIFNKVKQHKHLFISIALLLPAFFLFYPNTTTTIDEHDYLYNAQLLVNGNLKTDCSLNIPGQWDTKLGYCISKYNIGTSIFLIPAVLINSNFAVVTTLFVFIISVLIFYKILLYYGIDKRLIYFYALFPPYIFFTRTLLSEIYSMTILLSIFYCFIRIQDRIRYRILVGLLITLALYIRYTNAIPIGLMAVYFFYYHLNQQNLRELLKKYYVSIFIAAVGVISIMVFNYNNYGQLLRSGYYFSSEEGRFSLEQIPTILIKYFILTNTFYPALLVLIFKSTIKYSKILILIFVSLLSFYLVFKNESFPGKLSDIILGLRFIIPVYPFALVLYLSFLDKLKSHRYYKYFLYTSIALLIFCNFVINYIHYKYIFK